MATLIRHAPSGGTCDNLEMRFITPGEAALMLERTSRTEFRNRRLRPQNIERMKNDLRQGEFRQIYDCIRVARVESRDGDAVDAVVDGQHRLHAVAEAGVGAEFLVARIPIECVPLVDDVARRSHADNLEMCGVTDPKIVASVCRVSAKFAMNAPYMSDGQLTTSQRQLDRIRTALGAEIVDAVDWTRGIRGLGPHGLAATVFMLTSRVSQVTAARYMGGVISGEGLQHGAPELAVRDFLLKSSAPGRRRTQRDALVALVKGWNARHEGRSVRQLKLTSNGKPASPRLSGLATAALNDIREAIRGE